MKIFLGVLLWVSLLCAQDISDLPLREGAIDGIGDRFVLLLADNLSAEKSEAIIQEYHSAYVPTVGWSVADYFWRDRDPDQASADLQRVLEHYLAAWNKSRVILIGSERGASLLPFMVNRLPADLKVRIAQTILYSPADEIDFAPNKRHWFFGLGRKLWDVKGEVGRVDGVEVR